MQFALYVVLCGLIYLYIRLALSYEKGNFYSVMVNEQDFHSCLILNHLLSLTNI